MSGTGTLLTAKTNLLDDGMLPIVRSLSTQYCHQNSINMEIIRRSLFLIKTPKSQIKRVKIAFGLSLTSFLHPTNLVVYYIQNKSCEFYPKA
jgi:hypothetical protein